MATANPLITDLDTNANEGESSRLTVTLYDLDSASLNEASILTLTLTLTNEADGTVINSRTAQDVKDANGGVLSVAGVLTMYLGTSDNVIVGSAIEAGEVEYHIARFVWTWNDGIAGRTGAQEFRFGVCKDKVA